MQSPSSVLKQTANNPAQADYFVWGWPGAEGGTPTFGKFWLTMMPGNYFEPRTSGSGGPCDAADIEIQFLFGFGLNDTLYNFYAETATITHYIFWDSDGDGFTNPYEKALGSDATNPASTPSDFDGDGVTNIEDAFPNDASETLDADGDGVGDNTDAFPNDASETLDTDGDGVGDNADVFPSAASETTDTDGDGVGDNADAFPNDPTRWFTVPVPVLPWFGLLALAGLLGLFGLRKLKK